MTTPQLPPLPEQVLPCPFCGGRAWITSNRDTHKLFAEHSESCLWADDEDPIVTTPATDYAMAALIESWNTRAAISTSHVAESIHAENAKTLQALVDELREMLGVKDGESLKEAVQRAISDGNRYQWWATTMFWRTSDVAQVIGPCESADQLDAAIDAAMNDAAPIKKEQEA